MVNWMNEDGEGVSIDGKTLKGAFGFLSSVGVELHWKEKGERN